LNNADEINPNGTIQDDHMYNAIKCTMAIGGHPISLSSISRKLVSLFQRYGDFNAEDSHFSRHPLNFWMNLI